ncbi:hypothetical protein D3C83_314580 [compost metagenome]
MVSVLLAEIAGSAPATGATVSRESCVLLDQAVPLKLLATPESSRMPLSAALPTAEASTRLPFTL